MQSPRTSWRFILAAIILAAGSMTLHAQSTLTTTFVDNNGQSGNMFDVKALVDITIDSFDVNITTATGDFEVWALNTPGGYLGNETSNVNWTLLATVTGVVGNGGGVASPLNLALNFPIFAGNTQAFYVTGINGTGVRYTNGTTTGSLFTSNSDLEFYEGHGGTYFNLSFNPRIWNGNIHYTLAPTVPNDVGVTRFTTPTSNPDDCSSLSTTESITVDMRNFGSNPLNVGDAIVLQFTVDGTLLPIEVFNVSATITSGQVFSHTVTNPVDLSAIGNHNIQVTIFPSIDTNSANDNLMIDVTSGGVTRINTYPYVQDFTLVGPTGSTTPPGGFIQEKTDGTGLNSDWIFRNDSTLSAGTGPTADHTTGIVGSGGYAYVEDAGNFASVNLRSPCFDLAGINNPSLRFFLHSLSPSGSTGNPLSVDVISYPSGALTFDVFGPQGSLGSNWELQAVDLSAFAGQTVQFVFRGSSLAGIDHDVAIDDLSVLDLLPVTGQEPLPGLAHFDMNGAANINADPVSFGYKGPFFSQVTAGDTLLFELDGEPNQSIILLSGVLNSTVASFPGVGIMDIGGVINGTTGLPTGLSIIADGNAPGLFNDLFDTGPGGAVELGFSVPLLPPGIVGGFQCVFFRSGAIPIALSNAIELEIL